MANTGVSMKSDLNFSTIWLDRSQPLFFFVPQESDSQAELVCWRVLLLLTTTRAVAAAVANLLDCDIKLPN